MTPHIVKVTTPDGACGIVDAAHWSSDEPSGTVLVEFPDGHREMLPRSQLHRSDDASNQSAADQSHPGETVAHLPVVEEELHVGKRVVEGGGVRITRRTHAEEQLIQQVLQREAVEVERIPINRVVSSRPGTRQEGDALVIPIVEEELVVRKQLVLREELYVRKRVREETVERPVTVHRQSVDVEKLDETKSPHVQGTSIANAPNPRAAGTGT